MCTQGAEPGKESDTQDSTSNNAKTLPLTDEEKST